MGTYEARRDYIFFLRESFCYKTKAFKNKYIILKRKKTVKNDFSTFSSVNLAQRQTPKKGSNPPQTLRCYTKKHSNPARSEQGAVRQFLIGFRRAPSTSYIKDKKEEKSKKTTFFNFFSTFFIPSHRSENPPEKEARVGDKPKKLLKIE
ncbi:MAG: hypothetical protein Q4C03_01060 [bacterium]|nr:hypothetical protein [bacterium]